MLTCLTELSCGCGYLNKLMPQAGHRTYKSRDYTQSGIFVESGPRVSVALKGE